LINKRIDVVSDHPLHSESAMMAMGDAARPAPKVQPGRRSGTSSGGIRTFPSPYQRRR